MVGITSLRGVPFALAGTLLFAQPAHAALGMLAMPMAVTSALAAVDSCSAAVSEPAMPGQSKAAALLGGKVSQLELLRQQQAGASPTGAQSVAGLASGGLPQPGAGGGVAPGVGNQACSAGFGVAARTGLPVPQAGIAPKLSVVSAPDTILASKRLAIRSTPFDREWNRVRGSGLARSVVPAAIGREHGKASLTSISAVNTWANTAIRYAEDRELYGQADRWATARETLRRRAGDCEDIAIVKMQLLAAQGVSRENMSLVIARDLVRGTDHAVLVVVMDGKSWLLDNATDQVLDASQGYDYRPIMSFSQNSKWIHGY